MERGDDMADVSGLREHAVLDGDVTNAQLELYLNAAMGYLKGAGVVEPSGSEAGASPLEADLYDLAVYQVATHYYEQRGLIGQSVAPEVFGVQGIIHQLQGYFTGQGG